MNTIDLTPLLQAVLSLAAALITLKLIPWIAGKTAIEKRETLTLLARTLVMAAEQIYGSGRGEEKMAYVQARLREYGFAVDIAAIEAAVKEMNLLIYEGEEKHEQ